MRRHEFTDVEWRLVEPLLPRQVRGGRWNDQRTTFSGMLWVLRTSASKGLGDTRAVDHSDAQGRALEHGLHVRPASGRSQAPRADRGRPVRARGAGAEARGLFSADDVIDVLSRLLGRCTTS